MTTTTTTVTNIDTIAPLNQAALVNGAMQHIDFLRKLHTTGITLREPSAKSIERYLNLWLPMMFVATGEKDKENFDDVVLIPPADIAWLWHCHRLAPLRYREYTLKHFGKLVESNAPFEFQQKEDRINDKEKEATQAMWHQMYPDEPFFHEVITMTTTAGTKSSQTSTTHLDADGFDLIGSAGRQKMFLWHVSQPRFEDVHFLQEGVVQYYKFLALQSGPKTLPLVPTFQIDLIWHTHIVMNIAQYNQDCIRIRGEVFHHDDSMDDRTPGALLDRSFQETCRLWAAAYQGESYIVAGAMYRGPPPQEYLENPFWDAEAWQTASEIATILLPVTAAGSNSTGVGPTVIGDKIVTVETCTTQPDGSILKVATKTIHHPDGRKTIRKTNEVQQPLWKAPNEADGTFIKAAAKSQQPYVNNNPMTTGYVFGMGVQGVGYYSLETKDAYEILYRRLRAYQAERKADLDYILCWRCCFRSNYEQLKKKGQMELIRSADLLAYVKARQNSSGPRATLEDDCVKRYREKELRRGGIDTYYEGVDTTYIPGYWMAPYPGLTQNNYVLGVAGRYCDPLVPAACVTAGCGGGCGGASCGGGGCGGGGCGGGGCGGG